MAKLKKRVPTSNRSRAVSADVRVPIAAVTVWDRRAVAAALTDAQRGALRAIREDVGERFDPRPTLLMSPLRYAEWVEERRQWLTNHPLVDVREETEQ
jgi:hypothetical protein